MLALSLIQSHLLYLIHQLVFVSHCLLGLYPSLVIFTSVTASYCTTFQINAYLLSLTLESVLIYLHHLQHAMAANLLMSENIILYILTCSMGPFSVSSRNNQ